MTTDIQHEPQLRHIPVEKIAVINRRRKDLGDIQWLVDDIKDKGQLTPGIVRRATAADVVEGVDPEATPYVLVAGGRRYNAVCVAGLDTFDAVDRGDLPPLLQKIYELHENLGRKDLNWDEEVFLKEEIHNLRKQAAEAEGKTWSQTDTGNEVGESVANISRDLELARELRVNPELRKAPSKVAAVRAIKYERNIQERTARVNQTNLVNVKSRLHVADMKDFVRRIPENKIDLCFTDFKFGIDYDFDAHDANKYADSVEDLHNLLTDVIPQIIRVTKPTGWLALMMGSTNYEYLKDLIQSCCSVHYEYAEVEWRKDAAGDWIRQRAPRCLSVQAGTASACRFLAVEDPEWIWFRPNSRNPSKWPELHAQNQYEKFAVVNMGQAVMIQKNLGNVLVHDAVYEDRIHEMQRPHSLCLDVIQRLSVGGELVADFCFGSGSALAAAAELQRDFLGCDMNPKCLGPALMWVSEHLKQPIYNV